METIIWKKGEEYIKTKREDKPILNNKNEVINNLPYRSTYQIKKKDLTDGEKYNEVMKREMLVQTCQNPFLVKNYNEVIEDQEKFLIPVNSSMTS
tara:strand:+ start:376 stop:660 length:285 start_codon:yes stop_codon:yes gene_type:complete